MTNTKNVNKQAAKAYREMEGPDGEPMKVRVMPPDAAIEDLEAAVLEDGAVAMTDEQAEALDQHFEQGVRDGRAV